MQHCVNCTGGGIKGQLWKVVADLCTQGRSSVRVHGGLSSFGFDSGLGQGRALSPLLFNLADNGAAAAVKRNCSGVSLGTEPGAPKVSTLLYADDLCILAETPEQLQRALHSLSEWAGAWRFEFSAGEDKSAVMVVGGRGPSLQPFRLGSLELPFVTKCKYLGVTFDAGGRGNSHVQHIIARGNQKFGACVAWAQRERVNLSWTTKLFRGYVLDAATFGLEFVAADRVALGVFDRQLRQWGRRLLTWPSGAPSAAVYGDLGWIDAEAIALQRAAGLWSRLRSRPLASSLSPIPAVVFQHASTRGDSWASWAEASLRAVGVADPSSWNVGPGQPVSLARRWRATAANPCLADSSTARLHAAASNMSSLDLYNAVQQQPHLDTRVHNSRISPESARDWGLARCGHHPFSDGRAARHRGSLIACPLCDNPSGSLVHALATCPGMLDLRHRWSVRTGFSFAGGSHDEIIRQIFCTQNAQLHDVQAHVAFVSQVCQRFRMATCE